MIFLAIAIAWFGDDLVIADTVIRIGDRVLGEPRRITAIAVRDGKVVEVGGKPGRSGRVAAWDLKTGKRLWEIQAHKDLIYSVAWGEGGIYTTSGDGLVGVFDAGGKELAMWKGHAGAVLSVAECNGTVASGGSDRTIRIWRDGKSVHEIRNHSGRVGALAFDADGKRLASGSADGTVRIWQVETARLLKIVREHGGEILAVAWRGDEVLSGCADGKVRRIDVERAAVRDVVRDHGDWVEAIAVSGETIASADAGGSVSR